VLPFENLSGDPEQQYFSDGITEDVIIELSRFRSLFVIARNSAFAFKGRSMKVQDIAHELGVAYIVEGSVRRAGDRVRINAQLVDAATGNHLWAERYERDMRDIFALQDEVARSVAVSGIGQHADIEGGDLELRIGVARDPERLLAGIHQVPQAPDYRDTTLQGVHWMPEAGIPHCSIGRDRPYDRYTQSLIARSRRRRKPVEPGAAMAWLT
jgi:TolB-like protein